MMWLKHFVVLVAAVLFLGTMGSSCENPAEKMCGPCGTIANGDATITGMAQLDGVFKALGTLNASTGSIKASFDGQVEELAAVFGIAVEGKTTAELVAEIKTEFDAQISDHLDGGISVKYEPPTCSADLSVSASAQAQCEAKADCDVDVSVQCDPGELSVACDGQCSGGCDAECTGSCTVTAEAAAECSGTCKGSCDLSVDGGGCAGECTGTCDGDSVEGVECAGVCQGSCELPEAGGECSGECRGECTLGAQVDATCDGKCEGECGGQCTGGCEGSFEPPSCGGNADVECEASADCQAQASAQASASMSCTPPTLQIDYEFSAGADASVRAEVSGKLAAFKTKMVGIVKGFAELRALLEGNADYDIDPPLVTIAGEVKTFLSALRNGEIEVEAAGLLPCAIPAFEEAAAMLDPTSDNGIYMSMQATVSAQLDLLTLIGVS